ncbi:winged helix-turn-helix transcriptional regulator [bacterium]|nr:winged helix-turn-helix transcriptional regulator [bacterium]
MRPALDEFDLQFLRLVDSCPEATIPELCKAAGVTATAVRQRLARLQDLECVERLVVRAGRGRPYYRYHLTNTGRSAFGDNYAELSILLWDEIQRLDDTQLRKRLTDRLRERFVKTFGATVTGHTLEQKLEQLRGALKLRGFQLEHGAEACHELSLKGSHCPYHELAQADPTICEFEQQVYETILGSPLQLVQSCRNGGACCEFRVAATEEKIEQPAEAGVG